MPGKKEKDFQMEFCRAVKHLEEESFYHKIIDTGIVRNPYDCFVVYNSTYYACELKICKTQRVINFKTLFRNRKHELDALERTEKAGGKSFVLVNHFIPRKVNRIFVLPIKLARRSHEIGQMKIEVLEEHCMQIEKVPGKVEKVWDISKFIV